MKILDYFTESDVINGTFLINGKWYDPLFGVDTIQHIIDDSNIETKITPKIAEIIKLIEGEPEYPDEMPEEMKNFMIVCGIKDLELLKLFLRTSVSVTKNSIIENIKKNFEATLPSE